MTKRTEGNVAVKIWLSCVFCWSNARCSRQAMALRPTTCNTKSAAKPIRTLRQAGACNKVCHACCAKRKKRCDEPCAHSPCAKSHSDWAATTARWAAFCMTGRRCNNCSTRSTMAGSAMSGACAAARVVYAAKAGNAFHCATLGGNKETPWPWHKIDCDCSGVPVTHKSGCARGENSGTKRCTTKPLVCKGANTSRNQDLLQMATKATPPIRGVSGDAGSTTQCKSATSSSTRSSSKPFITAPKRAPWLPGGNWILNHESRVGGIKATTSPA